MLNSTRGKGRSYTRSTRYSEMSDNNTEPSPEEQQEAPPTDGNTNETTEEAPDPSMADDVEESEENQQTNDPSGSNVEKDSSTAPTSSIEAQPHPSTSPPDSPGEGGAAEEPPKTSTEVNTETTPTADEAVAPDVAPPQPVVQDNWSKLNRDDIIDKVKGVIYGQAIGDALGLATEFMNKKEAAYHYGKEGPEQYSQIINDFHRSRWTQGDWTDDTDQMLLILQMIVERKGTVDKCAFAKKMDFWRKGGFPELGDYGGMGIGMTVSRTLSHSLFLTDPHQAAADVWEKSGRYLAANGAIMRTGILGVLEFNNTQRVVANTREICLTTHADPRCLASCVAVTTAIALMLQGKYDPHHKKELEQLVAEALSNGEQMLQHEDQKKEFKKHVLASKLKELDLENAHTMGYTFKAAGAGFYGLRTSSEFLPTLRKVIAEAGDADSNGAVCGALMGCKFGFSGLPDYLLAFPHRDWLDRQVDSFLATVGLKQQ